MTKDELLCAANNYRWYHQIKIAEGLSTESIDPGLKLIWDFILDAMKDVDFEDKRVLDVGCRDGLFSFEAERRGAKEIIGIDNDLSRGATEFLIPHFHSKVRMEERNLYDLDESLFGKFDVIMCFGVLYHLRYPITGLKKLIDLMADGGLLLIESGMMTDERFEGFELLYCPVDRSPYGDPTSCTFFNKLGLEVTMRSLGCGILHMATLGNIKGTPSALRQIYRIGRNVLRRTKRVANIETRRQFFIFQKRAAERSASWHFLKEYWENRHNFHSGAPSQA